MGIFYYIMYPFSWLLNLFYVLTGNYGMALICFAVVVKLILFPLSIKGKRGMIQMNMLSGKMQQLQRQYGKDQQRYQLEVQKLYERENVNPMSGCLWNFVPLLILIPLYSIIREPMVYMMSLTAENIAAVADALNWQTVAVENGWVAADMMAKLVDRLNAGEITSVFQNTGYNQMYLASLITEETLPIVDATLGEAGWGVMAINFSFLGLDLAMLPTWKIWENFSWPVIGSLLLIAISAGSSFMFSKISMRTNQMSTGNKNEQVDKTNKMMTWMMPLMSLWIGFVMPVALCLYWVIQNLLSMVQEVIAGKILKKDYEAARLAAEERERQEKIDEKRRKEEARLERARRLEEEKKNKGKKKAEPKTEPGINKADSKIGMRTYARGRAYDPNRFGGVFPYVDPNGTPSAETAPEEQVEEQVTAMEQPAAETAVETTVEAPVETVMETQEVEVEVEQIEVEVDEENKEGV